jgi:hypothetical protein
LRFGPDVSWVMVADRDGGHLRPITERKSPDEHVGETVWSPDGSVIAVAAVRWTGRMEHALIMLPADGGEPDERGRLPARAARSGFEDRRPGSRGRAPCAWRSPR